MFQSKNRLLVGVLATSFVLAGCQTAGVRPAPVAATTGPGGCKPLNGGTSTDPTTATVVGGVVGAVAGGAIGGSMSNKRSVGTRNGLLLGAIAGALAGNAYAKATQEADGTVKLNVPGSVLFPSGSSTLGPDFKSTLDSVASTIKEYCGVTARVVGHTDNVGAYASNVTLSQRRAQSVTDYLSQQGVEYGRLTSEGVADTQPIASNGDSAGRQQNRRVEIFIRPPAP